MNGSNSVVIVNLWRSIIVLFGVITTVTISTIAVVAHDSERPESTESNTAAKNLDQYGLPPVKPMQVTSSWAYSEMKAPGTYGIGTAQDPRYPEYELGEIIILDGVLYGYDQSQDKLVIAPDDLRTPYAMAAKFQADAETEISGEFNSYQELQQTIEDVLPDLNHLYVVFVEGVFPEMVLAKLYGPAPPPGGEFTLNDVEGTMLGVYTPGFLGSLTEPPFHFHFVNIAVDKGGHVEQLRSTNTLKISFMQATEYRVHWPEKITDSPSDL